MGWKNPGERPVVGTPWLRPNPADVELPGGRAWTTTCSGFRPSCWRQASTPAIAC